MAKKNLMRKYAKMFMICTLTLALSGVAACGTSKDTNSSAEEKKEESTEETKEETTSQKDYGVLKIGMDGAHAPYCAVNEKSGELEGFEVDMMNEISNRTGLQMELEVASWNGIFGMLDSGQLTSIACSVEPNDERKQKYAFTENYIEIGKTFAVPKGMGEQYKSLTDLAGKKVGCRAGGNSVAHLEKIMSDNNIEFEIVPYDGGGMDYDLSLGRLDAYYDPVISVQASIDSGEFEIEQAAIGMINPAFCAYPFAKGAENSDEIIALYNGALDEMKKDGTLKDLSMKWFNVDVSCK